MRKYTIKELLTMSTAELRKLSVKELKPITSQITTYAKNRKKSALEVIKKNKNMPIPQAYRQESEYVNRFGEVVKSRTWRNEKFSMPKETKNKQLYRNKLLKTFTTSRQFLEDKTSTITGWRDTLSKFKNRLSEDLGVKNVRKISMDKEKFSTFWEIYNQLTSIYPTEISTNLNSNQLQAAIAKAIDLKGMDIDTIILTVKDEIDKKYRETIEDEDIDEFSFQIDNNRRKK